MKTFIVDKYGKDSRLRAGLKRTRPTSPPTACRPEGT